MWYLVHLSKREIEILYSLFLNENSRQVNAHLGALVSRRNKFMYQQGLLRELNLKHSEGTVPGKVHKAGMGA